MTQRTLAALAKCDDLLALLKTQPPDANLPTLLEDVEALRRAIAAFHMEAIRFRMYAVDRALKEQPNVGAAHALFDQLRHALEEAGFHTRSHAGP